MVPSKKYFPFLATISLLLLLACGADEREEFESKLQTKLEHHPPKQHRGVRPTHIPVLVQTNYAIGDSAAQIFYRVQTATDAATWRTAPLPPTTQDTLLAVLPPAKKGTTWEYYFQIITPTGATVTLPRHAPEKTFQILFKGDAARWLKISHLIISRLTILIMALAAFFAWRVISKSAPIHLTIWFFLAGYIALLLGTLLGIGLKLQVYGVIWHGFPFGTDMTDLFSVLLLIYGMICLAGVKDFILRRPWPNFWYSDATLAYLTLAGATCYIIVGILAHHL